MHPATVHDVGVITKRYFAIFEAFMESMTLNLAQRSFKGHRFWYQSKARIRIPISGQ